jgi:hypothetical protein
MIHWVREIRQIVFGCCEIGFLQKGFLLFPEINQIVLVVNFLSLVWVIAILQKNQSNCFWGVGTRF